MKDNFKFPSQEEGNTILNSMVKLSTFMFAPIHDLHTLIIGESTVSETKRNNHLLEWNYVLESRINKLNFAFVNAMTYYNRSLIDKISLNVTPDQYLLEFYIETFYNLYSTIVDILAQIVSVYYNTNLAEKKVDWKTLKRLNVNGNILLYYEEFNKEYYRIRNIRNSFNHRFPDNFRDWRLQIDFTSSGYEIGPLAKVTLPKEFISNMETSMQSLAIFTVQLQGELALQV